jgi:hypothetical protein
MPSTTSSLLLVGSVALATVAAADNPVAEVLVGFAGPLTGRWNSPPSKCRTVSSWLWLS